MLVTVDSQQYLVQTPILSRNYPMADEPPAPSPSPPPSPFSFPDGDIILRSADNVDLRVHTTLLSVASPFFRDMFSLPKTSNELQTIQMTEEADVLVTILRLIYPLEEPSPYASELVVDVYQAADKLQITKVQPIARRRLCAWLDAIRNPLEAWALAMQLDIPEAIASAKRRFISVDTKTCEKEFPECLKTIPMEQYATLIQLKEVAIQRGWECFTNAFTCITRSNGFTNSIIDCTYCIKFTHYYRLKTRGTHIFESKARDLGTLRVCHSFAESYKCARRYDMDDPLWLENRHSTLQKELSVILSEID